MKKARKLTAILMAAVMVLSMFSVNVFATLQIAEAQLVLVQAGDHSTAGVATATNVGEVVTALCALATDPNTTITGNTLRLVRPVDGTATAPIGVAGSITGTVTLTNTDGGSFDATGPINITLPANNYGGLAATPEARVGAAYAWLSNPTTSGLAARLRTEAADNDITDVEDVLSYINTSVLVAPISEVAARSYAGDPLTVEAPNSNGSITGSIQLFEGTTASAPIALNITLRAQAAVGGEVIVSGSGQTVYVDTERWEFVLPTSASFDFILDPLGLLGSATAIYGSGPIGIVQTQDRGRIFPLVEGVRTLNLSSRIANLYVEFEGTGDANFVATGNIDEISAFDARGTAPSNATSASVNYIDGGNRVAMWLVPNATEILNVVPLTDRGDHPATGTTRLDLPVPSFAHATAAHGFLIAETPNNLTFRLPAAEHAIFALSAGLDFEFDIVEENFGHGQIFQIGGLASEVADWSYFYEGDYEVGIDVTFRWDEAPIAIPPAFAHEVTGAAHLRADNATAGDAGNLPNLVDISGDGDVWRNALTIPARVLAAPRATASLNADGSLLTVNVHNFALPATAGEITLQMLDTRNGNLPTITSAVITRVSGTEMTIALSGTWLNGAAAQQAGHASRYVITAGDYTITIQKPNAGLSALGAITVART